MARSGIFAALFFAAFAIFVSFHHHEAAAGEVSSHHCAVCQQSSGSKILSPEPVALAAPAVSFEILEGAEASQTPAPFRRAGDPIRGPPLA